MAFEDDISTFEGWVNYQGVDPLAATSEQLAAWRQEHEAAKQRYASRSVVGLMKLRDLPGEYRYAVGIRDGGELWLTLWVRRSPKGEVFIFQPRADGSWNPHTSYHSDGTVHLKSHDHKMLKPQKRQPLNGHFKGVEHLGLYFGHGHRSIGAVCDSAAFSGMIEAPPGLLGPKDGGVAVDLVEPGLAPVDLSPMRVVEEHIFRDVAPWLVIRLTQLER